MHGGSLRHLTLIEGAVAESLRVREPAARGARIAACPRGLAIELGARKIFEPWSDPTDYPECRKQAKRALARFITSAAYGPG